MGRRVDTVARRLEKMWSEEIAKRAADYRADPEKVAALKASGEMPCSHCGINPATVETMPGITIYCRSCKAEACAVCGSEYTIRGKPLCQDCLYEAVEKVLEREHEERCRKYWEPRDGS